MRYLHMILPAVLVATAASPVWAADPESGGLATLLDRACDAARPPEAVRMAAAILGGSQMGANDGWFGPAETRYTWAWLARLHGVDPRAGAVARDKFRGPPDLFARLDRNQDGRVTLDDLDWSDRSPWVQQAVTITRLFRRLDARGGGRLTRDEWDGVFDKLAGGKEHVTAEDLRDALLAGVSGGYLPGDAPTPDRLLRGLLVGEVGSMSEGPRVGAPAPNFALRSADGGGTVELSRLIGGKPVVLVLGNFTCGPFRGLYPGVEDVYRRHKGRATFQMVYVREAHPTDGWKMESNTRAGVAVRQPTTFAERAAVAGQFCGQLRPEIPVAVDDVTDPAGRAYSGMPARLYVIDRRGRVAYKSGRGPFGFKPGEMEQALVMCLLDEALP